jgi:hypothetical protein
MALRRESERLANENKAKQNQMLARQNVIHGLSEKKSGLEFEIKELNNIAKVIESNVSEREKLLQQVSVLCFNFLRFQKKNWKSFQKS